MNKLFAVIAALLIGSAQGILAAEALQETVEQHYDVDPAVSLRVANVDGSIRIYGGTAPKITIFALKKAYVKERLHGIVVDVNASKSEVTIKTVFPPRKGALSDRSGTVDYIIIVPQTAKVSQLELTNGEILVEGLRPGSSATARLANGWVVGHNCFGDLDLRVETGRLDVAYDWWENHEFAVKAFSARGNIRASFPTDASINLSASAPDGRITNAFAPAGSKPGDIIHSIAEVFGSDARTAIALEARRGNIRIEKTY
ncbi:MAG TPA: hypothetical protein VM940_03570 [Chthoniobacterales bacterium]|nr:hypothetical protein [Chthoniobacterales bacterium]